MAKKPKVKKQGGGLKVLLDNNWEKIAFGLAIAIGAGVLSMGLSARKGIEASKTPDQLNQKISDATSYVNGFEWSKDFEPKRDLAKNLRERADETLKPLAEAGYSFPQMIKPPYHPPRVRRTDPVLFAAEQLEARAGFGFVTNQGAVGEFQSMQRTQPLDGSTGEKVTGRAMPQSMTDTTGMGFGGEGMRGGYAGGAGQQETSQYFVVVTGLVPYRKQIVEYLDRFKNADDFNTGRDLPRMMMWKVQRASVDKGKVGAFKTIANAKTAQEALAKFGASNQQEVIDPQAIQTGLTLPNPMIRTHNLEQLSRHSKILPAQEAMRRMLVKQQIEALKLNPKADIYAGGADGGMAPGFSAGFGSFSSGREGGRREGPGAGPPDSYGGGPSMMPAGPPGGMPAGPPGGGRREGGGGGYGFGSGGGYSGLGDQSSLDPSLLLSEDFDATTLPEYKMFRYFDFNVKPGAQYQYRLILEYEDPNNPQNPQANPPDSALASEVARRKFELKKKNTKTPFIRATEPAAPSNIVRVSAGEQLLAGDISSPVKTARAKDMGVPFRKAGDEPKIKVMAVEYDEANGNELAHEFELGRGGMPYGEHKVEPIARSKAWLEKSVSHSFAVDEIIIDIRGGEDLGVAKLTAPAEALVWNTNAQRFDVLEEMNDEFRYPMYIVPKGAEQAAGEGGYGAGPPGAGPPGGGREGGGREGGRPR